jgi:hypothetical protein
VKENERGMKMVAKVELITLGYWDEYIGEGSVRLEENRGIISLPSLHNFLKKYHTICMLVHTGRMPFFLQQTTFVGLEVFQLA